MRTKIEVKGLDSTRVTITVPREFLKRAKISARKKEMTLSGYIRFAVSELQKGE